MSALAAVGRSSLRCYWSWLSSVECTTARTPLVPRNRRFQGHRHQSRRFHSVEGRRRRRSHSGRRSLHVAHRSLSGPSETWSERAGSLHLLCVLPHFPWYVCFHPAWKQVLQSGRAPRDYRLQRAHHSIGRLPTPRRLEQHSTSRDSNVDPSAPIQQLFV